MKEIILLGATGSIGTQVLDIIKENKDFLLKAISFGKNKEKAIKIINEFKPLVVSCEMMEDMLWLKEKYPDIEFVYGEKGLEYLASLETKKGLLINAIVGIAGLVPTITAIKNKKDILLANKETLVVAGDMINSLVKEYQVKLLPIDSEHSAILQCLENGRREDLKKIIITASGGSFRDRSREELENVTFLEAMNHPNWSMGAKITVDSSTMVNKGLEVIEAHHLFNIDYDKIETILHRESIIHSMVEFNDGSVLSQMATPDMRLPINYALNYPKHLEYKNSSSLNLVKVKSLTFEKMDFERFPMLELAYKVGRLGGILPLVYNVANEEAVKCFIEGKIKYLEIEKIITDMVNLYQEKNIKNPTIEEILKINSQVRKLINEKIEVC